MSRTDRRGWNRAVLAERIGARDERPRRITEAEFYLTIGKIMRKWLRRGCHSETLAHRLEIPLVESMFALRYADSSPALILRALVEDWSWKKIKQSLREPQKSKLTSRKQR